MTCANTKPTNFTYCYSSNQEWCCAPNDNRTECSGSNSSNKCYGPRSSLRMFYPTYCKGAANPPSCGVDNLDIAVKGNKQSVSVNSLPYSVIVSNGI